jgi:hypothetical protein
VGEDRGSDELDADAHPDVVEGHALVTDHDVEPEGAAVEGHALEDVS